MENISIPKIKKKLIYSFKPSEIEEILNTYNKNDFIGYRNYTIMSVLLGTGIRKSELLNLNIYDVDFDISCLHILGKGNKERLVPIGAKLRTVIHNYLNYRKKHLLTQNHFTNNKLFISKDSKPLSTSGLNTVFRTLKNTKRTWSTRVSAHTFRHTFAKLFLLNGGDLFSLQKILGHEDISITRVYVDYNEYELKMQIDRYNPLDNTRWKYL